MLLSIFCVIFLTQRVLIEEKKMNSSPKYILLCKTLFQFLMKMGCGIYYNKYNILYCASMLSRFSHVWPFMTVWTVACQAPLSTGFSRLEYESGLLFPPPWDLPHSGSKPGSTALWADYLPLSHLGSPYSCHLAISPLFKHHKWTSVIKQRVLEGVKLLSRWLIIIQ